MSVARGSIDLLGARVERMVRLRAAMRELAIDALLPFFSLEEILVRLRPESPPAPSLLG